MRVEDAPAWLPPLADRVAASVGFRLAPPQTRRLHRQALQTAAAHDVGPDQLLMFATSGSAVLSELVEAVLVGETYWFRDEQQLRAVCQVLAPLPQTHRTVWAPGCSTGQEVHSLAILLRDAGVWPTRLLATDVSDAAVAATRDGVYQLSRQRGLDPAVVARCGQMVGEDIWQVDEEIRAAVSVRSHNLLDPPPVRSQAIVCRNVLIYLTADAVQTVVANLADGLAPDGTLVLGHAEVQLPGPGWTARRVEGTYLLGRGDPVRQDPSPRRVPAAIDDGPDADDLLREGEAALDAGRLRHAVALLRRARFLAPHDPVCPIVLGIAVARTGDDREAARLWDVAAHLLEGLPAGTVLAGGHPYEEVQRWLAQLMSGSTGA